VVQHAYTATVDVLSDVIATMRVGRPHSARVVHRAPFGRQLAPVDGAGFHVVLQGSAWLLPDAGDPVALATGDIVFLPHGSGHGLADSPSSPLDNSTPAAAGDGTTTVLLCGAYFLDQARQHPLLRDLPEVVHLPARVGGHPQVRAALELLGHELSDRGRGSETAVSALLDLLLLYILRSWYEDRRRDPDATGWAKALLDPWVSRALHGIHSQPGYEWTVAGLALEAALSRSAFSRRFTALVGRPPLAYLTWWRMTIAARLLATSDVPLAAVAGQVGYASEFSFAHAFKREHGHAPGKYRHTRRSPA
jgi:AraC-like DNA-binding protein